MSELNFEKERNEEVIKLRQTIINLMDYYEQSENEDIFINMYNDIEKFIKDKGIKI